MAKQIFRVSRQKEYLTAGPTDLIMLEPVPGGTPLFISKWVLETLVYGIVNHEFIHLSGPTGSAKSSLLEALYLVPDNFMPVAAALKFTEKPLEVYPIEMATFEAPGELYQRRALANGTTYDEKSTLVQALEEIAANKNAAYPLIWLREMGRVHSSSVQGGLLNLMTKGDIILPDATRIAGQGIAWVADSNYQAESDSTHTLVTLDDALKRRFSINLTLDYLPAEHEVIVLKHLLRAAKQEADHELVEKVVNMGQTIRKARSEGALQSVPPPTIYGYLAFLTMAEKMRHLTLQQVALATLLGNASDEDKKLIPGVLNKVFGLHSVHEEELDLAENLF
ncbi:MAG: hypothetical protein ACE5IY_12305 [bacterium]